MSSTVSRGRFIPLLWTFEALFGATISNPAGSGCPIRGTWFVLITVLGGGQLWCLWTVLKSVATVIWCRGCFLSSLFRWPSVPLTLPGNGGRVFPAQTELSKFFKADTMITALARRFLPWASAFRYDYLCFVFGKRSGSNT